MFRAYDLVPTDITGNAGTQTPINNSLVAWNGWHSVGEGFNTDGSIYGINDDTTDIISFDLGELTQLNGQTIRFKRRFNRAIDAQIETAPGDVDREGFVDYINTRSESTEELTDLLNDPENKLMGEYITSLGEVVTEIPGELT